MHSNSCYPPVLCLKQRHIKASPRFSFLSSILSHPVIALPIRVLSHHVRARARGHSSRALPRINSLSLSFSLSHSPFFSSRARVSLLISLILRASFGRFVSIPPFPIYSISARRARNKTNPGKLWVSVPSAITAWYISSRQCCCCCCCCWCSGGVVRRIAGKRQKIRRCRRLPTRYRGPDGAQPGKNLWREASSIRFLAGSRARRWCCSSLWVYSSAAAVVVEFTWILNAGEVGLKIRNDFSNLE